MTDAAMLQAPAHAHGAFPVKAEARASPFPFAATQQRVTQTTVVSQTTRPAAAAAAAAAGHTSVSTVSAMAFDLDFLDPNSSASAGLSGLPSAHLNRNPLDDLNLLDAQPPLLTMPGDTDTAAAASVGAPLAGASALVAGAQQFSDASSVSSADGSPLSPNDSANQSFSSTPTSPLTPGSPPISPGQPALAPHAAAHALMPGVGALPGQMPQLQLPYGTNAAAMAAWSMAAAASSLPLPMYPLSSASAPAAALAAAIAAQQQRHATYTPQAAAAYAQAAAAAAAKPTAGLSVQLPQAAARAAAKPQPAKAAASASASASVSPPSSAAGKARGAAKPAPAKPEPALSSAAKGRRGKGAAAGKPMATASPSGSDDDDGADGTPTGVPGQPEDKRSKRERNKLSAMKYRKRRKVYLDGLEGKVNDLNETVTSLHTENKLLKEQLDFLKNLLKSGGGELPEGFTGGVKFGDTSKPMSHVANQPPALPKIPRPSQHAKPHSTLALFCVLACVLLCITSPNSLFSFLAPAAPLTSHGGALSSSTSASVPAFAHAPPSEVDAVAHRSRVLLECVCARPSAADATDGSPAAAGDAAVSANADAANANHTAFTSDCACADEAADAAAAVPIDVEQCDTAVPPAQPEVVAPAVSVH